MFHSKPTSRYDPHHQYFNYFRNVSNILPLRVYRAFFFLMWIEPFCAFITYSNKIFNDPK